MKEVLQILDQVGGRIAKAELLHLVKRRTGGELTEELLASLRERGLVECSNGTVAITDAGAARLGEEPATQLTQRGQIEEALDRVAAPAKPEPEPHTPAEAEDIGMQVLALRDQGLSNMAIAEQLGIEQREVGRLLSSASRRKRARPPALSASPPRPRAEPPSEAVPPAAAVKAVHNSPAPPSASAAAGLRARLLQRKAALEAQLELLDEVLRELS